MCENKHEKAFDDYSSSFIEGGWTDHDVTRWSAEPQYMNDYDDEHSIHPFNLSIHIQ